MLHASLTREFQSAKTLHHSTTYEWRVLSLWSAKHQLLGRIPPTTLLDLGQQNYTRVTHLGTQPSLHTHYTGMLSA